MSKTPSNMLPLGTIAPDFNLPDILSGVDFQLSAQEKHSATVIMFICNHCPYVIHVNEQISRLAKDYGDKIIQFIAINANDIENYPQDAPEYMIEVARQYDYRFPYLFDESQDIAKAYQAACTPDFYVFDTNMALVYRGQLDGSRPGNGVPVTGEDIRNALDAILAGTPVADAQKPSLGCNIKWKA